MYGPHRGKRGHASLLKHPLHSTVEFERESWQLAYIEAHSGEFERVRERELAYIEAHSGEFEREIDELARPRFTSVDNFNTPKDYSTIVKKATKTDDLASLSSPYDIDASNLYNPYFIPAPKFLSIVKKATKTDDLASLSSPYDIDTSNYNPYFMHKCDYQKFGCKGHEGVGNDDMQSIHAMHAQVLLNFIKTNQKNSQGKLTVNLLYLFRGVTMRGIALFPN